MDVMFESEKLHGLEIIEKKKAKSYKILVPLIMRWYRRDSKSNSSFVADNVHTPAMFFCFSLFLLQPSYALFFCFFCFRYTHINSVWNDNRAQIHIRYIPPTKSKFIRFFCTTTIVTLFEKYYFEWRVDTVANVKSKFNKNNSIGMGSSVGGKCIGLSEPNIPPSDSCITYLSNCDCHRSMSGRVSVGGNSAPFLRYKNLWENYCDKKKKIKLEIYMFLFLNAKQTMLMSNKYFLINKSLCMRMNTWRVSVNFHATMTVCVSRVTIIFYRDREERSHTMEGAV